MDIIRSEINKAIFASLDAGVIPWQGVTPPARHVVSGLKYSGVNLILLNMACQRMGFKSPYWATAGQWTILGGKVRERPSVVPAGQWGSSILVYRTNAGLPQSIQRQTVFNLEQVVGVANRESAPRGGHAQADQIIKCATVRHEYVGQIRYFYPPLDYIVAPKREQFEQGPGGAPGYYYAMLHETLHWTEPRLSTMYGPVSRELRAEIGTYLLIQELGLDYPKQNRNLWGRLHQWKKLAAKDERLFTRLAVGATRGVDFLLHAVGKHQPRQDAPLETTA